MPRRTSPDRRTLVVRLDSFGDVLVCGPAIRAVAAASQVTLLCGLRGRPAADLLPGIANVIEHHAGWIAAGRPPVRPAAIARLVRDIAARGFDDAVILTSAYQSSLPTALLLRLAGVARITGLSVDSPGSLLDRSIREDLDVHEVERALAIVELAGYRLPAGDDGELRVALDAGERLGDDASGGYVVVHPGASVPARTLAPATWMAVIEALCAAGRRVVVTGLTGEGPCLDRVHPGVLDLVGATDARGLAAVLAGADAVCVGNTGAMHLAAAVGTPVCAVFAPTVPVHRWRPWAVAHVLLGEHDIACRSCRATTCPLPTQQCLAGVSPAAVVAAVDALADRSAGATAAEEPVLCV